MSRFFVLISLQGTKALVPLDDVREILPMLALAPAPPHAGCLGVANLRGTAIPVFGTGLSAAAFEDRFILVSSADGAPAGWVVDEVLDVMELPAEQIFAASLGEATGAEVARAGDELIPIRRVRDAIAAA